MFGWHMDPWSPGTGGVWGVWALGHLAWWVLIGAGIVVLWRLAAQRRDASKSSEDSALRLLRERYARGEIEIEEFEERRRHLQR